jgi:hypothetical protein
MVKELFVLQEGTPQLPDVERYFEMRIASEVLDRT